jgi:Spy/CpxP family protein refolding chaperone
MKKFILFTVFLLSSTLIFAQAPRGGGQRSSPEEIAKRNTEWMTKDLKLTPEQVAPVDSINLLYAKAQQALFQSNVSDREKLREAFTALNGEKEKAFEKVLTKDQFEQYKKKVAEMTERTDRRRQRS